MSDVEIAPYNEFITKEYAEAKLASGDFVSTAQQFKPVFCPLEQGTDEWLTWRKDGIGGSEAGAIMGSSPYMDVMELYQRKLGLIPEITANAAMTRGHLLEPVARVEFELETGLSMKPGCYMHPEHSWMRASLDGISADGRYILEIKAPGLTTHREALAGKIKPYYFTQMQHCMGVTGAEMCYYCSYTDLPDVEPLKIIEVPRDDAYIERMIDRERDFWQHILTRTEPDKLRFAVGDAGTLSGDTRTDPAWGKALDELLAAQKVLEDAQAQYAIREARVNELMQRKKQVRVRGAGVLVERVFENGQWTTRVEQAEDEDV
jgi:putative phage-type endonuclease